MKLSAKPMSSPGRTDKFPPPLMRFLRSNVGSRSSGRLRSSPMFVRRKNTAVETQEPTSPKVTCMGQVRVKRSSVASSRPGRARRTGAPNRKRCEWIQKGFFCSDFPGKIQAKSCSHVWRKWVPFFQAGFCRKAHVEKDPPKIEPQFVDGIECFRSDEDEEEEQEFERKAKVFASSSSSPPKNALLLTRCRSAPYRSSSLACRFWGSPTKVEEETGEAEQSIEEPQNRENCSENERPTSESESISDQESRIKKQNEEKMEFFKGLELSIRERMAKSSSIENSKEGEFGPLILTRCKSEPARTAAEKLDPDSLIHGHQVFVIN